MSNLLKLAVTDEDDLAVISAHLQDAVMLVGDMRYAPADKSMIFVLGRFDWRGALDQEQKNTYARLQTALQFDRVEAVQTRNIRKDAKMAVLSLLSIGFEPTKAPSGYITLVFSGGGAIRLDVECIEGRLADLGPQWETTSRPWHEEIEATNKDG